MAVHTPCRADLLLFFSLVIVTALPFYFSIHLHSTLLPLAFRTAPSTVFKRSAGSRRTPLTALVPTRTHRLHGFFQQSNLFTGHSRLPYIPPSHTFPHECHVVGHDSSNPSSAWAFNSRAFCLTSAVCVRPATPAALPHLYVAADRNTTTCSLDNPDLSPVSKPSISLDCAQKQLRRVHCAHGKYANRRYPTCPVVRDFSALSSADNANAVWLRDDEIALVVPGFAHTGNIFHFSYVAATVTQLVEQIPSLLRSWRGMMERHATPRKVRIIFRGDPPRYLGNWPRQIFDILLRRRMRAVGFEVEVTSLGEDTASVGMDPSFEKNTNDIVCARSAVLLGDRKSVNVWPFANNSAVPVNGLVVPVEALLFRRAIYDEFGITSRLPMLPERRTDELPKRVRFDLPPLVLGYARRDTRPDPPAGMPVRGATRRFSDADDAWFISMLRAEAGRVNAGYRAVQVNAVTDVEKQVRDFAEFGVVVGIHGANLVNGLFSPALGAMVEVIPRGVSVPCYHAGMNSGLWYQRYEAPIASERESGCKRWDRVCRFRPRGRRVKINEVHDRREIRWKVRAALEHVRKLHDRFADGIPMVLDEMEGIYILDER